MLYFCTFCSLYAFLQLQIFYECIKIRSLIVLHPRSTTSSHHFSEDIVTCFFDLSLKYFIEVLFTVLYFLSAEKRRNDGNKWHL